MKILNLISYTHQGLCQNIGDLFSALSLRFYLCSKTDQWKTIFYNEEGVRLNNFDLLIVGGGGLYHPGHLERLAEVIDWNQFKLPLAIVGLGLNLEKGTKLRKKDISFMKLLHEKSFVNSCRDQWTFSFLKKIGIKSLLTGCPSLFLPRFYRLSHKKKYDFGINIGLYHAPWYQKNQKKIIKFIEKNIFPLKGEKIFICHNHQEQEVLSKIWPHQKIFYSINPQKVFTVYSQVKTVIGMRAHSQIFSLAVATPSLAINASEKVVQPVKMVWPQSKDLIIEIDDNLETVKRKVKYLTAYYHEIKKKQIKLKRKLYQRFRLIIKKIKEKMK